VGVGQDEVDIVRTADVVAVVLVPGMGDDIQALKAGILEIADLFVINKADRDGVDRLEADLTYMLSLAPGTERLRPAIHRTIAVRDEGIVELSEGLAAYLQSAGERRRGARRRERAEARLLTLLRERLVDRVREAVVPGEAFGELVDRIVDRRVDPYTAVHEIVARLEVR
jgi:LAO/AO transport system kinase